MSYTAKSVILDIADNWGSTDVIGIRQIEFYNGASLISLAVTTDFVAYATSYYSNTDPHYAFDTSTSKSSGSPFYNEWGADSGNTTNQRLICVFVTPQTFTDIVVNNGFKTGDYIRGAQNVKIQISSDTITDTTYDAAVANSEIIYDSTFDVHTSSDVADDKTLSLIWDGIVTAPDVTIPIIVTSNLIVNIASPEISIPVTLVEPSFFVGIPLSSPEISIDLAATTPVINLIIPVPEVEIPITIYSTISIILISPDLSITTGISEPSVSTFSMAGTITRYLLTITGAADSLEDFELPMSSFQARRKSGEATYLSVVVPTMDYAAQIAARSNGTIKVEQAFDFEGDYVQRELILEADIDNIQTYEGGRNQSVVLEGYKTTTYTAKSMTLTTSTYRSLSGGKLRYRVAKPNVFLNPGDTVTIGDDTFIIGTMAYAISPTMQQIELEEA